MVHLCFLVVLSKVRYQIRVATSLIEIFLGRWDDSIGVVRHLSAKLRIIRNRGLLVLFRLAYISDRTSLKILISQYSIQVFEFVHVGGIAGAQSNGDSAPTSCAIFQKCRLLFDFFAIDLSICSAFA